MLTCVWPFFDRGKNDWRISHRTSAWQRALSLQCTNPQASSNLPALCWKGWEEEKWSFIKKKQKPTLLQLHKLDRHYNLHIPWNYVKEKQWFSFQNIMRSLHKRGEKCQSNINLWNLEELFQKSLLTYFNKCDFHIEWRQKEYIPAIKVFLYKAYIWLSRFNFYYHRQ